MARNTAQAHLLGSDAGPVNAHPTVEPSPAPAAGKPDDPIATPTLAQIYIRQGLPGRALEVYRKLLRSDPFNAGICRTIEELEEQIRAEEEISVESSADEPLHAEPAVPRGVREVEALTRWAEAARRRRRRVQ